MSKQDKLDKAKKAMQEINKKQKEVVLDFASNQRKWERQSSGIKEFDNLTGGFTYGHTNIVWGQASAGKSSLMYHTIAQAQKDDKVIAFLDLEDSFNEERAKSFGVKIDELIVGHYEIAEQALDTILKFAREKAVDMIILDSIHSMAPKGAVEDKKGIKSLEQKNMALLARTLGEFFARATTLIYNANIALIMIGQTRTDLGGFIALQKLSGGNALIHNSVLTVHLRRGAKADAPRSKFKELFLDPDGKLHKKTQDDIVGFDTVAKINKKQVSGGQVEGQDVHLPFYFDTGFIIPLDSEMEERIVGTEEEKEKIKEMLRPELSIEHGKQIAKLSGDYSENPAQNKRESEMPEVSSKKRKRGRPKKS